MFGKGLLRTSIFIHVYPFIDSLFARIEGDIETPTRGRTGR